MATNGKLGLKKRRLLILCRSAKVYEKRLGWTRDVYSFHVLLHVHVTHAACEQFLLLFLLLPLLWGGGFGALKPLPRLLQPNCGSSWKASRIAAWIPAEPPKGPWRTPAVMECVSAARTARHNPQLWKSVSGCVWMFFFFFFPFLYDFLRADPIDLHSDPA